VDFFFDTGVFLGLDDKDVHYKPVATFLDKYPRGSNRYFSARAVREELDSKRRQFTRRGLSKTEIRRIFQIITIFVWQNSVKFTHYEQEGKKHPSFDALFTEFFPIVGKDYFDATILANAFLWEYENGELARPTVVTTDDAHFYKPKEDFFRIASKHLNRNHALDIQCVWDC
jgi:hypothetical protein